MGCNPRLFHPHLCWRVRLHGPLDSPFIPQPLLDSNRSSSLTIRDPGGPFNSPVALGTCICGTRHRHDPERVPGSRDCFQPSHTLPAREIFPSVLSRIPYAPVTGQGLARTEARARSGMRSRCCDIASRRTSSPVRAARRLNWRSSPSEDNCASSSLQ